MKTRLCLCSPNLKQHKFGWVIINEVDGSHKPSFFWKRQRLAVRKSPVYHGAFVISARSFIDGEDRFQSNHNFPAQNHKDGHKLNEEGKKIKESFMIRSQGQAQLVLQLPLPPPALCANPRGSLEVPRPDHVKRGIHSSFWPSLLWEAAAVLLQSLCRYLDSAPDLKSWASWLKCHATGVRQALCSKHLNMISLHVQKEHSPAYSSRDTRSLKPHQLVHTSAGSPSSPVQIKHWISTAFQGEAGPAIQGSSLLLYPKSKVWQWQVTQGQQKSFTVL